MVTITVKKKGHKTDKKVLACKPTDDGGVQIEEISLTGKSGDVPVQLYGGIVIDNTTPSAPPQYVGTCEEMIRRASWVAGETYPVKDLLRATGEGFIWNGKLQRYDKKLPREEWLKKVEAEKRASGWLPREEWEAKRAAEQEERKHRKQQEKDDKAERYNYWLGWFGGKLPQEATSSMTGSGVLLGMDVLRELAQLKPGRSRRLGHRGELAEDVGGRGFPPTGLRAGSLHSIQHARENKALNFLKNGGWVTEREHGWSREQKVKYSNLAKELREIEGKPAQSPDELARVQAIKAKMDEIQKKPDDYGPWFGITDSGRSMLDEFKKHDRELCQQKHVACDPRDRAR